MAGRRELRRPQQDGRTKRAAAATTSGRLDEEGGSVLSRTAGRRGRRRPRRWRPDEDGGGHRVAQARFSGGLQCACVLLDRERSLQLDVHRGIKVIVKFINQQKK